MPHLLLTPSAACPILPQRHHLTRPSGYLSTLVLIDVPASLGTSGHPLPHLLDSLGIGDSSVFTKMRDLRLFMGVKEGGGGECVKGAGNSEPGRGMG